MTTRTGGFFSSSNMSWDKMSGAMFNSSDLTPRVRQHVKNVYLTLAGGCAVATAGVYTYMMTHISHTLPLIVSMMCIFLLASTPREQSSKRLGYFGAVAFSQGVMTGSLVEYALYVEPSLVLMALSTTLVLFLGFSFAAFTSERRSYLYLGGMLYSALGWMSLIGLFNWFFQSQLLFNVNLYGGLVVFMGYVIFDTQMMIEKASLGDYDHVSHALELFLDLGAIFVRILIILLKDNEDKRKRNNRRQ